MKRKSSNKQHSQETNRANHKYLSRRKSKKIIQRYISKYSDDVQISPLDQND